MATPASRSFDLDPQPTRGIPEQSATSDRPGRSLDFPSQPKLSEAPSNKLHSLVFQEKHNTARTDTAMHIVLIDVENMQAGDLGSLDTQNLRVYLFLGQTQTRLPLGLVQALQPLGSAVTFVHGKSAGRNSMDTLMAFYLGRMSVQEPDAHFTVVSKDTGFDTLLSCMKESGVQCRRVTDAMSMDPASRADPTPPMRPGTADKG